MKKKLMLLCVICLVLALVAPLYVVGCATQAPTPAPAPAEGPILWRLNTWQSATRMEIPYMEMAAQEIYERSNGRLTIEIYPAFSLGHDPTTWLRDMKEGAIDISCVYPAYTGGEEPSFTVDEMPGIWKSKEQALLASDALFNFKKRIYKDVWNSEFISSGCILSQYGVLFTTGTQVKTLTDVEGLKIRTPGGRHKELWTLLGAAPQMMPQPDIYMALKTGVIDGCYTGSSTCLQTNFYEVTSYAIPWGPTDEALAQDIVVSNRAWNELTPDLQQILRDVWERWAATLKGRTIAAIDDPWYQEQLEAKGVVYSTLSEKDTAQLREYGMQVFTKWISETGGCTEEAWQIIKPFLIEPATPGEPEEMFK